MNEIELNGVVTESVSQKPRAWEALQRKISAGTLPEIAAEDCGIPWEEAEVWLKDGRKTHDFDDDGLRAVAARALERAVDTLERLAAAEGGRVSSKSSMMAGCSESESVTYDDLDAAKALLDGALKIRRLLTGKKVAVKEAAARDLFDQIPTARSPWSFRKAD